MSSKPGFWGKCRFAFRCARFTVWVLVLLVSGAFAWLDFVGVPNFVKTRLVAALQERGVQLEFTRMRVSPIHGLMCDNVRIGATQAQESGNPVLTAREVHLHLDFMALLHRKLEIKGLVLHQGNFTYPLAADDSLNLTNLESELRFESNDTWALDQFHADFSGVTFMLGGEIAHAPEFKHWKMFASAKSPDRGDVQASLRNFSDTLKKIHFEGRPQISARLSGDATDVHSFTFTINTRAPGVKTPWFSASDLQFTARVLVPTNAPSAADPAWGFWTNLEPFRLDWTAHGKELQLLGLSLDEADGGGNWLAPHLVLTNLSVQLGGGSLNGTGRLDVATRVVNFTVDSGFNPQVLAPVLTDKAREQLNQIAWTQPPHVLAGGSLVLSAWTNAAPDWRSDLMAGARVRGELALTNFTVGGAAPVDSADAHFVYEKLDLALPDLHVAQGRTALDLSGELDQTTSNFRCVLGGALDGDSVKPYLNAKGRQGFKHLYFRDPVALVLDVTGNLRDFTTLSVTGRVVATHFAIRGQFADSLKTALTYTNLTAEFLHPELVRADGAESATAERVTLDLAGQRLFLHHAAGHLSSMAIGNAIGPKTAKGMAPYQFLTVPQATADGCIPLRQKGSGDDPEDVDPTDADLWVNVVGTAPFQWLRFRTPEITGNIHWLRNYLILTNVVADCYGGPAHGWAKFNLMTPGDGTDFSFFAEGTNVDFNAMGRALWSPTNQLRGLLAGNVTVTHANSSDLHSWNGYGQMQLHNGLIWDAPVFGLMSPLLNSITPGLDVGNSRATDGAGRFTMTNGVIYTDSLEIRSLTMRLDYIGTVDLQENISARARAQLLRNTPVVGSLLSTVLWPVGKVFECGVSGTLEKPKITPVYIPFANVISAPLHPWRTMEGIFAAPQTNNAGKL